MVTYAQLNDESWYRDETEAPAHAAFNARLRTHYGHTPSQTGSKGDNNHLRGRHRSRSWTRYSGFCTSRAYGDSDTRDKTGSGNWLRATDIGITGAELRAASARLDAAVRAGRLPAVAEWFGTIDGRTVVGWHQGHASSSDDSHLYHLHVGLWTSMCDDSAQLALLGDIITGANMPLSQELRDATELVRWGSETPSNPSTWTAPSLQTLSQKLDGLAAAATADAARDAAMLAAIQALAAGGTSVDTAAVIAAVNAVGEAAGARDAELRAVIDALRTENADLLRRLRASGEALADDATS